MTEKRVTFLYFQPDKNEARAHPVSDYFYDSMRFHIYCDVTLKPVAYKDVETGAEAFLTALSEAKTEDHVFILMDFNKQDQTREQRKICRNLIAQAQHQENVGHILGVYSHKDLPRNVEKNKKLRLHRF